MYGAIIGDIVGSIYEFENINTKKFPLFGLGCTFTDDTVMTCAVAKVLIDCKGDYSALTHEKIIHTMQEIGRRYPRAGYGGRFYHWMFSDHPEPYNSCGNGSAMRISPVGFLARNEEELKYLCRMVTEVSHNHPEGMKGAECTAMCIWLARNRKSMPEIRAFVEENYYLLEKTCDDYRKEQGRRHGKELCQISVPQALVCFFESRDYDDCIRNCISIGGDSDTIAAIAGGIAEAYYGIPDYMMEGGMKRVPEDLKEILREYDKAIRAL